MYLFYDETGFVSLIHYMKLDGVDYENERCIKYDGEIPQKEGFVTNVFVKDGEVVFEYEEIPKTEEETLLERLEKQEKQLSVLSDTVDFLIMEGAELDD